MGVLAGRFPGKTREGTGEQMLSRLAGFFKRLFKFAEEYGMAIADREIEVRLERKK